MIFKKWEKLMKCFLFHLGLHYDQTIGSWGSQATLWLSGCSHFCVMSLCIDRQNHPCIQVKRKYFSSVYLKLKCFKLAYFLWISFATLEIETSHGLGKNKLQLYFCQYNSFFFFHTKPIYKKINMIGFATFLFLMILLTSV